MDKFFMQGVVIGSLGLAGCSQSSAGLNQDYADKSSLDALTQRVDSLTQTVGSLDRDAELKLSDTGFSTIRTEYGAITLQWVSAAANGAGSKITFKIGNPHSAKLTKIELYGHAVGADGKDIESKLLPWPLKGEADGGSWTNLSAIVDDVPPQKIASIRVTGVLVGGLRVIIPFAYVRKCAIQ